MRTNGNKSSNSGRLLSKEYIIPDKDDSYKIYIDKILAARPNELQEIYYMEQHHIIPHCLGGNDESENLIWLHPQEHYYAHELLFKENINDYKLGFAWSLMSHHADVFITADEYGNLRKIFGNLLSKERMGKNAGKDSPTAAETYQFDLYGNFIKRYDTILEASQESGVHKDSIQRCRSGELKHRTAGGYIWSAYDQIELFFNPIEQIFNRYLIGEQPVIQYDKNGKIIAVFNSLKTADFYGWSAPNIWASIKQNKPYKEYYWKYLKDEDKKELIKVLTACRKSEARVYDILPIVRKKGGNENGK